MGGPGGSKRAISRTRTYGGTETFHAYCCSVPSGTRALVLGIINPVASLKLVTLGGKRWAEENKGSLDFCSLRGCTSFPPQHC